MPARCRQRARCWVVANRTGSIVRHVPHRTHTPPGACAGRSEDGRHRPAPGRHHRARLVPRRVAAAVTHLPERPTTRRGVPWEWRARAGCPRHRDRPGPSRVLSIRPLGSQAAVPISGLHPARRCRPKPASHPVRRLGHALATTAPTAKRWPPTDLRRHRPEAERRRDTTPTVPPRSTSGPHIGPGPSVSSGACPTLRPDGGTRREDTLAARPSIRSRDRARESGMPMPPDHHRAGGSTRSALPSRCDLHPGPTLRAAPRPCDPVVPRGTG